MPAENFLQPAITKVKVAVEADNAGDYERAYQIYYESLQLFMLALKWEKNEAFKRLIRSKVSEYMDRAEKLKTHLADQEASRNKPGLVGANGSSTAGTAKSKNPDGSDATPVDEDTKKLRSALASSVLQEHPKVKWDDVAGLESAKSALKEAVVMPIKFPHIFTGSLQAWKAILLYGPPGTGKSYLAKAVATEAKSTFFSVSSSDLVSKWMGESERLVKQLFALAREQRPSVIFIDEVDALCGPRGEGESEASRRIKTELLVQMEGVGNDTTGVLVLAATNIPWQLDTAIRRRFQRRVHIGLPDAAARASMFRKGIGNIENISVNNRYKELAELSDGYSGSDIAIVIQDALMQPVHMVQTATHWLKVDQDGKTLFTPCSPGADGAIEMTWEEVESDQLLAPPVEFKHFVKAINSCRPSVSKSDLARNVEWTAEFGSEGN